MSTVKQSSKETPEAEKPKAKRSRAKAPAQSQPTPEAAQPETSAANLEVGYDLQQQIAQAVEPVLAEFRQQVARAVEEQLESDPGPGSNGDRSNEGADEALTASVPRSRSGDSSLENGGTTSPSQSRQSEGATESGTADSTADKQEPKARAATGAAETSGRTDDAEDQEQPRSQDSQGQTGEQSSQQAQPQARVSPSDGSQGEGPESKTASASKRLLTGGLQLAEQHGEKWLQSMVVAGVTALLAESSKTAAQQRAEQGLHTLLAKGFAAAPDGTLSPELQGQIERTSQAILRDTIEELFSEDVRASIMQESSEAVGAAVHGDFGAATTDLRSAAMTVIDELVRVLRRQWQRLLRLVFKAVLAALENSITDDDGDSSITSKSKKALRG